MSIGSISRAARAAAVLAVTGALMFAPAALGQGSAANTYGGTGSTIQTQVGGGGTPTADPPATQASSALPFTGLDIGLALGGGLLLLVTGFGISRLVNRRAETPSTG